MTVESYRLENDYKCAVSNKEEMSLQPAARGPGRSKQARLTRKEYKSLNLLKAEAVIIPSTMKVVNSCEMKNEWPASIQKELDTLEAKKKLGSWLFYQMAKKTWL